jgi:predicted transcriptional regulator
MAKSNETSDNRQLAELVAIKRLLIVALLKLGANQTDVAKALGVGQSRVSRMFPKSRPNNGARRAK